MLIVKVSAPGLHLLCIVARAPHSLRPEEERKKWWSRLKEHIHVGNADDRFVPVLLVDTNARVGEEPSDLIGEVEAESSNPNTGLFVDLLQHFAWSLPSTTSVHQGERCTWTSPIGHSQRIDFVACPR